MIGELQFVRPHFGQIFRIGEKSIYRLQIVEPEFCCPVEGRSVTPLGLGNSVALDVAANILAQRRNTLDQLSMPGPPVVVKFFYSHFRFTPNTDDEFDHRTALSC
jgi:hypothetical protein